MNTMKQFRVAGIRLLVLLAATLVAVASVVVFFDPATGYVLKMDNTGMTNAIVVTNSLPPGAPDEWILVGEVLRIMTPEEMTARDLWRDSTNTARLKLEAKIKLTQDMAIINGFRVLLSVANTNRLQAGLQAITEERFIELVHEQIDLH